MVYVIEYVDASAEAGGNPLSWEFAKTEDEAIVKARAHFLLFKARFSAQGYRILSPAGHLLASGPGLFGHFEAMGDVCGGSDG